jgi:hypothetical protein
MNSNVIIRGTDPFHSNSRLQKYRLTAIGRATACEILNEQF